MPLSMQVKLLRVLEEKVVERVGDHRSLPVNIRLVSATNRDLNAQMAEGRFREDLFYRVNSLFIQVPPLRERIEDIPFIIFHCLKRISYSNNRGIKRVSPRAMELIENYPWPGNVRQLINALEHASVTARGDTIDASDLPGYVFRGDKPGEWRRADERGPIAPRGGAVDAAGLLFHEEKAKEYRDALDREKLQAALSLFKGNRSLAAKHLGMSRVTLWKRLKELGL
jgi:two-component system response regulator HydG